MLVTLVVIAYLPAFWPAFVWDDKTTSSPLYHFTYVALLAINEQGAGYAEPPFGIHAALSGSRGDGDVAEDSLKGLV